MTGPDVPQVRDVTDPAEVSDAMAQWDLAGDRPVLVCVGGAGGLGDHLLGVLEELFRDRVVPVLARHGGLVVDGGTASGVMQAMGRAARGSAVPVIGVAAAGTVVVPGRAAGASDAPSLDADHRAVLLVPGERWGDESPWIAAVAGVIAGARASVTLLANGGEISFDDALCSVEVGRPLVVLAGSGRTADQIAAAARTGRGDPRALAIAGTGLVQVVDLDQGSLLTETLDALLAG